MVGKDVQSWFVAFSQALLAETELSELLDFVLTFTVKQAQADGGSLLLLDEAKGELIPKASLGLVPRQVSVKLGQGIAGWVLEHVQPVVLSDVTRDERWLPDWRENSSLVSLMNCVRP
jgi:Nif-specific regulatory protein